MMFALVVLAALAMAVALGRWQDTEMTASRWRLYALRDELRWQAIETGSGVETELMRELDSSLTFFCTICQQKCVSLWMFLATWIVAPKDPKQRVVAERFVEELNRNPHLEAIYDAAVWQIVRVLFWRHLFLTVVFVPTLVGGVMLYAGFRAVARRALTSQASRGSSERLWSSNPPAAHAG